MRRVGVTAVATLLVLTFGSPAASSSGHKLTKAQQAARDGYLAELQAHAVNDPILDFESTELKNRLVQPVDRDFQRPDYLDVHAQCEVIIAFIVERDGSVTHAKVIWSYGPSIFGERALDAVQEAHYEQPGQVDRKPVRVFTYLRFTFFVGSPPPR